MIEGTQNPISDNIALNVANHDTSTMQVDSVNAHNQVSRQSEFSLNKTRQAKKLQKNAINIDTYEVTINNYDTNVNLRCNTGFYAQVAGPALLNLAEQTCKENSLTIKDINIRCRKSADNSDKNMQRYDDL